jgi:hypothetical protein
VIHEGVKNCNCTWHMIWKVWTIIAWTQFF